MQIYATSRLAGEPEEGEILEENRRGVLYPQRLPEFHRLSPSRGLEHAVRWFWIPEWDLPVGVESRQELLPFPASNLVVEPQGVTLNGPATKRSERVLSGSGWAVGSLLRPAAAVALAADLVPLRDNSTRIEAPTLHEAVVQAMGDHRAAADDRRTAAARLLGEWLRERVPSPPAGCEAALANELERLLADPRITRVDQLPPLLHVSPRTLQRLALRCFGLSPWAMIRRRRLQEGAERLREAPELAIADLAAELGYSDHAHFSRDFKAVLGVTPSGYRKRLS